MVIIFKAFFAKILESQPQGRLKVIEEAVKRAYGTFGAPISDIYMFKRVTKVIVVQAFRDTQATDTASNVNQLMKELVNYRFESTAK
jgi:hypothetical protein